MRFPAQSLKFMRQLQRNNERDWFEAHRADYEAAYADVLAFSLEVQDKLAEHDVLEPKRKPLSRIYRDIRFSKDKTPYKRHWSGGLQRQGKERRGGYYWHVEPGGLTWDNFDGVGEAFVGGGFWAPERADLQRIREELARDHEAFRQMLSQAPVARSFDGLFPAEKLKRAPKGYDPDHPAIDLLNNKAFVLVRGFSKSDLAAKDFSDQVVATFVDMRPFLDYLSEVLTTDSNGVSLL